MGGCIIRLPGMGGRYLTSWGICSMSYELYDSYTYAPDFGVRIAKLGLLWGVFCVANILNILYNEVTYPDCLGNCAPIIGVGQSIR